jgi:hypothetical protein
MSTTQKTLVVIAHPDFREGYQTGRRQYFQQPRMFTDKQLVECLVFLFEEEMLAIINKEKSQGEENKPSNSQAQQKLEMGDDLYCAIGRIVGHLSGPLIACQPYEDSKAGIKEAFLAQMVARYGKGEPALADSIRQFWAMQDQFARTLDADSFDQMINQGVEMGLLLVKRDMH